MSQQTPYIGSKISLISKLDIRYEGILYTVDTQESTIALAKDRPTPNPVAGRDDVYEYIIFKASDIKDLIVCETPKPVVQLAGGLPYDPAIITVSQQHTQGASGPVHPPQPQPLSTISAGSSRSDTPHNAAQQAERVAGGRGGTRASPGTRARTGGFQGRQQGVWHSQGYGQTQGNVSYRNALVSGSGQQAGSGGSHPGGNRVGGVPLPSAARGRGGFVAGSGFRGGRGAAQQGQQGAVPRDKVKFESDYDFEKANEQFAETLQGLTKQMKKVKVGEDEKESVGGDEGSDVGVDVIEEGEVIDETSTGVLPKPENDNDETFYDKNSSFFDRISCEALERQEGKNTRLNWRKERETNQETFGHSAVRSLAYRRGGARGFRGGGFQQPNRAYPGAQQYAGYNNGARNYGGYYGGGYQQRRGAFRGDGFPQQQ